jgi:predicted thioesterase
VTGQTSRAVTFAVMARDDRGADVARGTITRVVVDAERFLARLA